MKNLMVWNELGNMTDNYIILLVVLSPKRWLESYCSNGLSYMASIVFTTAWILWEARCNLISENTLFDFFFKYVI